ncbi:MAG: BamA/TamA family outer membrane protein [Gemmatimonadota bacterium]
MTHAKAVLRRTAAVLPVAVALAFSPLPGAAQYFGRNKVQYDRFEFRVLPTEHFRIYYYPEEAKAVEDAARMGERWYERFARAFQHEFEAPKPLILYADHPDFQQTNALRGFIGEGTGGVTESLKNRVIMPLASSYRDTDHVLGHELVHAFQYNIAQSRRGGGLQGLYGLPLWMIEGMAEYMSVGRDDPLTAMWIRDAIRRDDLPTIKQMTRESRYFPYRFGQALWAYVGGTYGDDAIIQIYRRALRVGFEPAIRQVLGMDSDTLSARWKEEVAREYLPVMEGRELPDEQGTLLLAPSTGAGRQNVSPSVSPNGRYVAFLSEKDLFSVDLYLADTRTGKVVRKLSSANSTPHVEALRYIDSSGTWSPDGEHFAFVVTADGDNEIIIVRTRDGKNERRLAFDGIGAMANPAWSPDGRYLAFSGSVGGINDLYLYDLESGELEQLTDDRYADLQPAWSPDGRTLAFISDRGPETDFDRLTFSRFQLAFMDLASGQISVVPVFGNVKHMNPQFAPDGRSLYFISDQDGFSDIYRLGLRDGRVERITRLTTAVSGITYLSPAMSVAANTGELVYSVFDEMEFHIFRREPEGGIPVTVADRADLNPARKLPPARPTRFSRVATYQADATTGLVPPGTYSDADAEPYRSSLSLDFIGQPTIGVGTDNFGNYIGGGASAFFSDMLGDRILGVAAQAQGTFKDIGGQVFYGDFSRRWNWAVSAGRIPYQLGFFGLGTDDRGDYLGQTRFRVFISSLGGQVAYPLSQTQRVEFSAGLTRYSYDVEIDKFYVDPFGRIVDFEREQRNDLEPDPLNLAQTSVALVGDNSFLGFVGPIRGGRYRLEVEQTTGTVDFTTVIADWRRYYSPLTELTVAARGLHYGRYGLSAQENQSDGFGLLRPLFLGFETLIRGYAFESFLNRECAISAQETGATEGCPTFDRLFGQQIAVANFEFRVPLLGVERFGLVNFPYIPTELVLFADAGLAWDADHPATLKWSRSSGERVPVVATGVSARFNILGFMVFEAYYAYPWQRPDRGWHWGFQIAPAW